MNGLDMVTTSVLGALGCDMELFLRYFPAAGTMYDIFVALGMGLVLLNWVWQLFKNYFLRAGVEAEDPAGSGNTLRQSLGTTIGHSIRNSAAQYAAGQKEGGMGGAVFQRSLSKGGSFASSVVSKIAQGDVKTDGVLKGENASKALSQYMGFAGKGEPPAFRNVEIGGGRISGTEMNSANPHGVEFGMYHAGQYLEPRGDFETVQAADGSKWYKQYAQDTVDRKPYQNAEGKVAYQEKLVKRVPDPPKRKDRL